MRPRRIIRTTLGDLIISLTDQVAPLVSDRSGVYSVVGFLLSDLLTRHRMPADAKIPAQVPGVRPKDSSVRK
jgi:hypothetical protein